MQLKLHLTILLLLFLFNAGKSQTNLKIGHVNIPELVQKHPESDSIQQVLKVEADEMEKMYSEMITEHESKVKLFENEQSGYSEFVRKTKETELIEMAQKIQQYNQTAQQQLQKRNMELLQPVYVQITAAIKTVADSENFTYILDISNGTVAYIAPNSENITNKVMTEFGITSPKNP